MYILFKQEKPQNINAFSIGCSSYIPEFNYGVYLEDTSILKKHEVVTTSFQQCDEHGKLLYIDKNGVVSIQNGKPLLEKTTATMEIDFNNYPEKFTLKEVMLVKKQQFLDQGYDECFMYEFNLSDFINLETSTNYDAGINDITLKNDSVLDLNPITFKPQYKKMDVKIHSLHPISVHYSFDNQSFKKSNSIKLNDKPLFLKFKNTVKDTNILYDYQLLLKE